MSIIDRIRSWFGGGNVGRIMKSPDHDDVQAAEPRVDSPGRPDRSVEEAVRPPVERYRD